MMEFEQVSAYRWYIIIFLTITMTVSLATAQEDNDEVLTVGFSQVGTESDWRTAFTQAILAEAEARHINLLFLDAENSQENQFAALRYFISQQVDAIILAPVIETGWTDILR